jgi:hypothetical protein
VHFFRNAFTLSASKKHSQMLSQFSPEQLMQRLQSPSSTARVALEIEIVSRMNERKKSFILLLFLDYIKCV